MLLARLEIEIENAEVIAKALKPDDLLWSSCFHEDKLVIKVETHRIGAMLNAIDEYFINIKAAVSALNAVEKEKEKA